MNWKYARELSTLGMAEAVATPVELPEHFGDFFHNPPDEIHARSEGFLAQALELVEVIGLLQDNDRLPTLFNVGRIAILQPEPVKGYFAGMFEIGLIESKAEKVYPLNAKNIPKDRHKVLVRRNQIGLVVPVFNLTRDGLMVRQIQRSKAK
jgi:hypothetical protein